jgi:predicted RNA-binding protein
LHVSANTKVGVTQGVVRVDVDAPLTEHAPTRVQDESLKRLFTILANLEQKQHEYEIRSMAQRAAQYVAGGSAGAAGAADATGAGVDAGK